MRRRVGFLFIICAAVPVAVFASTAWACGTLTTFEIRDAQTDEPKSVVAPNEVVHVIGRNFAPGPAAAGSTHTSVQIRWASRTGDVLREVEEGGNFTEPVRIPADATPGWYQLSGTQFNVATGVPKSGSPARAVVRVQGAAVAGSTAPWGAATPTSGGPGGPDIPLPGLLLSVALLATGLTMAFRGKGKETDRAGFAA